ncbi:DUF1648 domain-containing protein [Deinococcus maricopensis]|uniref:DUF1648 domain-containing protein n=1 Tax=Deinococcus maricopensis (strain DSM 21211 / LMG 22137 / NRRL B-23946 / LB-34) TaxID=709986 RepID=E8U857_DEIML|nr:DUF1648 domain-containing protein [Deinococcus maricopensis]ADV67246.1 protein of unknown function DUF1648 [Deinococcus maricopensis DSM 21211]
MTREPLTILGFAAALLIGAVLWSSTPETLPVHWGLNGQPDRYGTRLEGLFALPAVLLLAALMTRVMQRFSESGARNATILRTARLSLALLALLLQLRLLLNADVPRSATLGLGLTFLLIGNVLGKAEPDARLERAPTWTDERRRAWYVAARRSAHRLFALGALLLLAGLFTPQAWLVPWVSPVGLIALVLVFAVWTAVEHRALRPAR